MAKGKGACAVCGADAARRCASCRRVWYCSVECQRTDWGKGGHKKVCKAKQQQDNARRAQPAPSLSSATKGSAQGSHVPAPFRPSNAATALAQHVAGKVAEGEAHAAKGDFDRAEASFREAMSLATTAGGPTCREAVQSSDTLAGLLEKRWRADVKDGWLLNEENDHLSESLTLRRAAHAGAKIAFGADSQPAIATADALARLQFDAGLMKDSCETYDALVASCRRTLGPRHPTAIGLCINYALALANVQKYDEAIRVGKENLTLCRDVLGPHHLETLKVACNLSDALAQHGDETEAASLGAETFDLCERHLGADHALTKLMAHRADATEDFLDSTATLSSDELEALWSGGSQPSSGPLGDAVGWVADTCAVM